MKIVHLLKKCDIDTNKNIYECSQCKKIFNWSEESFWYGNLNQLEFNQGNHIKHLCSSECKGKFDKQLKNKKS